MRKQGGEKNDIQISYTLLLLNARLTRQVARFDYVAWQIVRVVFGTVTGQFVYNNSMFFEIIPEATEIYSHS